MSKSQALQLIDKPLYRIWQAVYMSFYSPKIYVDVCKRWKGWGVLYLLLVIAIFSLPLGLRLGNYMTEYIDEKLLEPLKKMPILYVQNGKIFIDKPVPFKIKNKDGEVVAIVDTSGQITSFTKEYPHLGLLITKDAFYYRPPEPSMFLGISVDSPMKEVREQKLNENQTGVLDPSKMLQERGVKLTRFFTQVFMYPLLVCLFFSVYLVFLFTFSFLGQLLAQVFFGFQLKYKQACRLFAVSVSPQLAISLTLMALGMFSALVGFFNVVLVAIYYCFALLSIKWDSKPLVRT